MNIEQKHIEKILHLLSFGLTKGLGKQTPGKMCVEAAICAAFDLPHGDSPPCVGKEVREAKISLNDCQWPSNQARADGMKKLAIAQLGSDTLNQEEFFNKLKLTSMQKILPYIIQKHLDKTQNQKLFEYKTKFENLTQLDDTLWKEFYNNYNNNYNNYNNNYYYYYYYYHYYHYYYNNYYFGDEFLLLIADTILQVLIDMKSPGCQWLHLVK